MNQLRHLDDQILLAVNGFARHTPTLHGPVMAYAKYGVVLFGALLLAGLVSARHRPSRDLAATGWAATPCSPPSPSTSPSGACSPNAAPS